MRVVRDWPCRPGKRTGPERDGNRAGRPYGRPPSSGQPCDWKPPSRSRRGCTWSFPGLCRSSVPERGFGRARSGPRKLGSWSGGNHSRESHRYAAERPSGSRRRCALDRNRDPDRTGLPAPRAPTAASPAPELVGGRESRPSMCAAGHEGETRRSPSDAPAESLQASPQRRCGSWAGPLGWALRVRSLPWTSSRIRLSVSPGGRNKRRPGAGCVARRRTGRPRNTYDKASGRPRATR